MGNSLMKSMVPLSLSLIVLTKNQEKEHLAQRPISLAKAVYSSPPILSICGLHLIISPQGRMVAVERTKEKIIMLVQGTGLHCLLFNLHFKRKREFTWSWQTYSRTILPVRAYLGFTPFFSCSSTFLTQVWKEWDWPYWFNIWCVSFSVRENSYCKNHSSCHTLTRFTWYCCHCYSSGVNTYHW